MPPRLFAVSLAFAVYASGQVITTVAGTDFSFPPTPIAALGAPIGEATDLASDLQGNLYVSDRPTNLVYRIAPDGTLTIAAGNGLQGSSGTGGPATSAAITPSAITTDSSGTLHISSSEEVRKLVNGVLTAVPGRGGGSMPGVLAVDAHGIVYFSLSALHLVYKLANGSVTVLAGTYGQAGFSGDGGPAASAKLNFPTGLLADSAGNVFIADSFNNRVRKVAPDGTISTIAGSGATGFAGDGGPPLAAAIENPQLIRTDGNGNLYISNGAAGDRRIRKIAGGIISTLMTGITIFTLDPAGNIYASLGSLVRKAPAGGTLSDFAGNGLYKFSGDGGPATSASLNLNLGGVQPPSGVVSDGKGNIYISDTFNHRVRKISNGIISTVAGNGVATFSGDGGPGAAASLNTPRGLALAQNGDLYIADSFNNRVRKLSGGVISTVAGTNTPGPAGDGGPATSAQLLTPQGVALDSKGCLYICDNSYRIRKVSGGVIATVAGTGVAGSDGDGGLATKANIGPIALAIDSSDTIYLAEFAANRVRKIVNGVIMPFAGKGSVGTTGAFSGDGGSAVAADLYGPYGVTVDSAGSVYISDFFNNRIRKVTNGIISTFAGNGNVGLLGDGQLATNATVARPGSIFVDTAGNLFLADVNFSRVREVLAAPPPIQVTPAQLTFTASSAGALPLAQNVNLFSPVPGLPFSIQADPNAPWLTVVPPSGASPRLLEVRADPTNLAPGTYTAAIAIVAPNATPPSTPINVTFTVSAAQPPQLSVDKQTLSFPFPSNGKARTQAVRVSNAGGGSLSVTATAVTNAGANWLTVSPMSGEALPDTPLLLNVTADPAGLAPGTYTGSVTISGNGATSSVAVTMTISAINKALLLSQSGLSFLGVSQGGIIPPQSFGVINIGAGVVNWTVSKSTLSGGPDWLQVSTANGANSGASDVAGAVPMVTVTTNPSILAPGKYYGQVRVISSDAANSPQVLTVFLQVLPIGSDFGAVTPTSELLFAATTAESPGSQDILLYNVAAAPKTFRTSVSSEGGLSRKCFRRTGRSTPRARCA